MKFFIIACLVAAASAGYTTKTLEDLTAARKECVAEHGVTSTLIAEYKKRVYTPEGPTPCYIRCIFTRLGLFDETTGFNVDSYMTQLGKGETFRTGVTGCITNAGPDKCFWAFNSFMCFFKEGLLPEGY